MEIFDETCHNGSLDTFLHEVATPEPLHHQHASERQDMPLLWLAAATRSASQRASCMMKFSVLMP